MSSVHVDAANFVKREDIVSELEMILLERPADEIIHSLAELRKEELVEFADALFVLKKYLMADETVLSPQEIEQILHDLEREMQDAD